ncbi:glutaredoxin family protein [Bermanella sp. R86510]|uniref:glutaredoxin family protein n=1 Tax=unclassified Bermanella TaxID=2627862 RepID=UPI0037CC1D81
MAKHALYYYDQCPFCQMVLSVVKKTGVEIELRNTLTNPQNKKDLVQGGGRGMVPCLRIETDSGDVQWMYESRDISNYLSSL